MRESFVLLTKSLFEPQYLIRHCLTSPFYCECLNPCKNYGLLHFNFFPHSKVEVLYNKIAFHLYHFFLFYSLRF